MGPVARVVRVFQNRIDEGRVVGTRVGGALVQAFVYLDEYRFQFNTREDPLGRALDAARKAERTPRYREYLAHNLNAISGAIAEVLNQVTGKQRNHLAREIDGLRTRLLDLSAAPRQAADYPPAAASPITWQ